MATFISKVIADGRVTIPKDLREKQGIGEGDYVEIAVIRKIGLKRNPGEWEDMVE